uniref:Uncharacterized protein n=1 Tax=Manihot esculenta TaxID=3983 RepID=A0A2C9VL36_MANES
MSPAKSNANPPKEVFIILYKQNQPSSIFGITHSFFEISKQLTGTLITAQSN